MTRERIRPELLAVLAAAWLLALALVGVGAAFAYLAPALLLGLPLARGPLSRRAAAGSRPVAAADPAAARAAVPAPAARVCALHSPRRPPGGRRPGRPGAARARAAPRPPDSDTQEGEHQ